MFFFVYVSFDEVADTRIWTHFAVKQSVTWILLSTEFCRL